MSDRHFVTISYRFHLCSTIIYIHFVFIVMQYLLFVVYSSVVMTGPVIVAPNFFVLLYIRWFRANIYYFGVFVASRIAVCRTDKHNRQVWGVGHIQFSNEFTLLHDNEWTNNWWASSVQRSNRMSTEQWARIEEWGINKTNFSVDFTWTSFLRGRITNPSSSNWALQLFLYIQTQSSNYDSLKYTWDT